jgi:predicted  nucleic acid-binding Zn-ribbon protein
MKAASGTGGRLSASAIRHSGRASRSTSGVVAGLDREEALQTEIRSLEKRLKEMPYVDLRVELQDVEEIVQKAVKDLVANVEEQHEIVAMVKQIEKELKEIEEKTKSSRKIGASTRKRELSPFQPPEDPSLEQKKSAKMGVLKKLQQLKAKNDEQKVLISRFLTNICRQGKKAELEEKVTEYLGSLEARKSN